MSKAPALSLEIVVNAHPEPGRVRHATDAAVEVDRPDDTAIHFGHQNVVARTAILCPLLPEVQRGIGQAQGVLHHARASVYLMKVLVVTIPDRSNNDVHYAQSIPLSNRFLFCSPYVCHFRGMKVV